MSPYLDFLKESERAFEGVSIAERRDDSGIKRIYVSTFLKNRDWMLVFQQDASDAFSDLKKAIYVTLIILFLGLVGIAATAIFLSKRMVSRIVKTDREKEMMNRQIVEAGRLASVGELAAGIAHEINNPVAIMVEEAGWIGDLLEEEEFQESHDVAEFTRALKQIKTQGRRCKEITHKLLSFARKADSRIQEIHISQLIQEVTGLAAQRAKYSNVTIHTNLDHDLPSIQASPTELQQVILNLINNALDAMEKDGGRIDMSSYLEGDHIAIEVNDNGPGIPEANLSHIFDPFFTTKPVSKGTGLGLSICYGIIHKMGGDVDVKSKVGMGTSFRIQIPLAKGKPSSNDALEHRPPS